MRVFIQITEFRDPRFLNLADVPEPIPGEGELLINVSRQSELRRHPPGRELVPVRDQAPVILAVRWWAPPPMVAVLSRCWPVAALRGAPPSHRVAPP